MKIKLIHPFDMYELMQANMREPVPLDTEYSISKIVENHEYERNVMFFKGEYYFETTDVPPITNRIK